MESLSETTWDVVLSGTGLPQSLLALALSRSGKKVLHIDKNDYYGGPNAALSLQEAESWVKDVNRAPDPGLFRDASISIPILPDSLPGASPQLGFSRAYTLSLSPQIIYTRSTLLPLLISSKIYRQLEFLAVGSWWIYESVDTKEYENFIASAPSMQGCLKRIPGSREDVFTDKSIDMKSKRSLMKFLKLAVDEDEQTHILEKYGQIPFTEFLSSYCKIPNNLHAPLLALTLSPLGPASTSTSYALPRIRRHLTSIGVFGPGFGAIISKWGGTAEIAQVACRAGAVGGSVYMLHKKLENVKTRIEMSSGAFSGSANTENGTVTLCLQGAEQVEAKVLAGCRQDLPFSGTQKGDIPISRISSTVSIVSSPLSALYPTNADVPTPAVAIVFFPTGSIKLPSTSPGQTPPVYILAHSSETGECPVGQCILYARVLLAGSTGFTLLDKAIEQLLDSIRDMASRPQILWSLRFTLVGSPLGGDNTTPELLSNTNHIIKFPDPHLDLAFDDAMLEQVRSAWQQITGETEGFMQFQDREPANEYDDD